MSEGRHDTLNEVLDVLDGRDSVEVLASALSVTLHVAIELGMSKSEFMAMIAEMAEAQEEWKVQ